MNDELAKALGSLGVVGKAYDDLLHPSASELGKLFSLPFKVVNHYGDRLLGMMTKAKDAVPPERQLPAAPSIAGPIFENVKYLEEGNPLLTMYQKLLTQLIDRDGVANAHPAFPKIVEQLSADEAFVMYSISKKPAKRLTHWPLPDTVPIHHDDKEVKRFLMFPYHMNVYVTHLTQLNLIESAAVGQTHEPGVIVQNVELRLSEFGELFARACIPTEWDFPTHRSDDGTG